ncbi:MAG: MATE family efflux transporter [Clostridia bacterium]|nr:MATE family efflux transporter [Clostridia bacterium]
MTDEKKPTSGPAGEAKTALFETVAVPRALTRMAIPTIISQLITLIYNMADPWFIGRTNNPYMVAASSLVLTVFLMAGALGNLFGVGGGSLVVRLLGRKEEGEARRVASWTLCCAAFAALLFSLVCLLFMDPLLRLLGASDRTIGYARQYLIFVVVIGGIANVLDTTMSFMLRNAGYAREAAFGLSMGGVLNIALDPLFMFVLLPDGYQVMGAGLATMLSNVASLLYFVFMYRKVKATSVLEIPRRIEKILPASRRNIFSIGVPAALSVFLFDLTNIVINRLSASHGDLELAAIGIVQKVERFPLNIGIGICLGMIPLIAYNYASGNHARMKAFFTAARIAGLAVSAVSVLLYYAFAPRLISAFIADETTVELGTAFLRARCFATPFMFLSFNMVNFMQAVDRGKESFYLAAIRQLALNLPLLFVMNHFFGMTGIVWTQAVADILNVIISYIIYARVIRNIYPQKT